MNDNPHLTITNTKRNNQQVLESSAKSYPLTFIVKISIYIEIIYI